MNYTIKRSERHDDDRLDLPDFATRERGNGRVPGAGTAKIITFPDALQNVSFARNVLNIVIYY